MAQEVNPIPHQGESESINLLREKRLQEILDPAKASVLLIIDMQNDFVADDGKSAVNWHQNIATMQAIVPKVNEITDLFYKLGKPVVRTVNYENVDERTTAGKDRAIFMEGVAMPEDEEFSVACLRNSYGAELTLPANADDIVIEKNRSSAFTPELEMYLKENGIKTVFIVGVKTQRCIEATVRDLYDKSDVHVVVLEDCVASDDVAQHESSLQEMKTFYPPVITSDQLVIAWSSAPHVDKSSV